MSGGSLDYASAMHEHVQAAKPAIDFGHHRMHRFFGTLNNDKTLCSHAFQRASFAANNDHFKTILMKKASQPILLVPLVASAIRLSFLGVT